MYRRAYHQTIVFVQPYMDKAEAKMTEMNGKIEELKIAANAKLAELKIQGQMMLEVYIYLKTLDYAYNILFCIL